MEPSTEYAGRGAGRGNSAVVHGSRRTVTPASSNVALASSNHEQAPDAATCRIPVVRRSATLTSASAR